MEDTPKMSSSVEAQVEVEKLKEEPMSKSDSFQTEPQPQELSAIEKETPKNKRKVQVCKIKASIMHEFRTHMVLL